MSNPFYPSLASLSDLSLASYWLLVDGGLTIQTLEVLKIYEYQLLVSCQSKYHMHNHNSLSRMHLILMSKAKASCTSCSSGRKLYTAVSKAAVQLYTVSETV